MLTPYDRYRPTRTSDGQGGFTETLGSATTVYAAVVYQDNEPTMLIRRYSDLQKGDIVSVDGETYRVLQIQKQDGTGAASVSLEKIEKPI